ncbi:MAG: phosphate signaling complex protein PhoU [Alphaproteobacteria bacterium]|nr:phosphate signaling complex protein PhoU [Alphaproteobacteria bacterium]
MVVLHGKAELSRRRALEVDLAQMGAMAEKQLGDAISAFERRDMTLADAVVAADAQIDAAHHRIERDAIAILETEQPSGAALREIIASFKLANELERVGDLAKNVAKRTLVVSQELKTMSIATAIGRMGRQSMRALTDVLDAYVGRDMAAAQAVWSGDGNIDELYNSLFQETLVSMMREPDQVSACTHLVFISKNFERVGDHATNIAEVLHFLVTGEPLTSVRPKGDETPTTSVTIAN